MELLEAAGLRERVMSSIAAALDRQLKHRAGEGMEIEALFFSNRFGVLGKTPGADSLLALHRPAPEGRSPRRAEEPGIPPQPPSQHSHQH